MSQPFFCSQCGAKQEPIAHYCHSCGRHNTPLTSSDPPIRKGINFDSAVSRRKRNASTQRGLSVGKGLAGAGVALLLFCAVSAIAVEFTTREDEPQAAPRFSALLPECDEYSSRIATPSLDHSQGETLQSASGIEYHLVDARGGLEFQEELSLGPLDDNRGWLVVSLVVRNRSGTSNNLDSDDIWISADGKQIKEAGDVVDEVNEHLGLRSMGDMIGTSIDEGSQEEFSLVYKVPRDAASLDLVFSEADNAHINLRPFLRSCLPVSALVPTPTSTPFPSFTAIPGPTEQPMPTATIGPSPTPSPKPSPTPSPTPVVQISNVAGDWEVKVETAFVIYGELPTDYGLYQATGFYVAVPVEATNTGQSALAFSKVVDDFVVIDGQSSPDSPDGWFVAKVESVAITLTYPFPDPNAAVAPGESTEFVLVFDIPSGHDPKYLILDHTAEGSSSYIFLKDPLEAGQDGQ